MDVGFLKAQSKKQKNKARTLKLKALGQFLRYPPLQGIIMDITLMHWIKVINWVSDFNDGKFLSRQWDGNIVRCPSISCFEVGQSHFFRSSAAASTKVSTKPSSFNVFLRLTIDIDDFSCFLLQIVGARVNDEFDP